MKNIVFIVNQLRKSGPIYVLYNLVANLDRSNFNPIIIKLMVDDFDRSYSNRFRELQIEMLELNYSFYSLELNTRGVARRLDELLVSRKIDIIHSHGYHPLLVMSYMKTLAYKIDTQHCISLDSFRQSRGYLVGTYMHFRYIYRLQKINLGISISKTVRSFFCKCVQSVPFVVVYNGIDVGRFKVSNELEKEKCRKILGFPNDELLIVIVGHLSRLKDPLVIIRSFKSLIDKRLINKCSLIFCGDGELRKKCESMCLDYPMIKFIGYTNEVNEYLKAANYSICASHSEGFGLNYIEALIAGNLVVSSNIGAFNEFANLYPLLGKFQFEVANEASLEKVLLSALNSRIDILSTSTKASNDFSAVRMAREYMKIYDTI